MSLEFRKIPNQESQVSQLLYTTRAMQGPEQHSSRPRICTATLRHFGNYLVSDTAQLL